jgi:hypothetical protein
MYHYHSVFLRVIPCACLEIKHQEGISSRAFLARQPGFLCSPFPLGAFSPWTRCEASNSNKSRI